MKDLIYNIIEKIVDHPEEIVVEESQAGDDLTISIRVNQDDMGKVIGKQGRIAKAIRTVAKATATKRDLKVNVEILD